MDVGTYVRVDFYERLLLAIEYATSHAFLKSYKIILFSIYSLFSQFLFSIPITLENWWIRN